MIYSPLLTMNDLVSVFDFVADILSDYLLMMNSFWLTQIILYIVILGLVVSTILTLRGK